MNEKYKLTQISKYLSPSTSSSQSSRSATSSQPATPVITKTKSNLHNNLEQSILSQPLLKRKSTDFKSTSSKYFQVTCPVCSIDLSDLNETNQQHHMDQCLEKPVDKVEEPVNMFKCPMCATDLTSQNETDRQQHVNECLDKEGKNKKAKSKKQQQQQATNEEAVKINNEELLENAVPSCPICGKTFQSLNTRQNHMKKCAKTFHIKTESLVELVKKQQEGLERDLARGVIPPGVYFIKKKPPKVEKPKKTADSSEGVNQTQIVFEKNADSSESASKKEPKLTTKKETSKTNKKSNKAETPLVTTSCEQREEILKKRFEQILSKKINYNLETSNESTRLVETKFDSTCSGLWNKCKYFEESQESFYVKVFLDEGKFLVGNQVFAEKLTQGRFSDVELLNTQTAFLLADLNEQTHENMSVYYTQIEKSKLEFTQLQLNATQINKTINEEKTADEAPTTSNQSNSSYYLSQNEYWQPDYTQKLTQLNTQLNTQLTKPNKTECSIMKNIGLISDESNETDDAESKIVETTKNKSISFNPASPRIIIDETIMSSNSNSPQQIANHEDQEKPSETALDTNQDVCMEEKETNSDSINSKDSNILDQNLDTLEFESDANDTIEVSDKNDSSNQMIENQTDNQVKNSNTTSELVTNMNKTIDITDKNDTRLDEDEEDQDLVEFLNKTTEQSILESSNKNKKRKSVDVINVDLNTSSKKFKQDETVELIDEDDTESSKASDLPCLVEDPQKLNKSNDSNSCEIIANASNEPTENENEEAQVLKMIEKSLNQAKFDIDLVEQDNALDEVWNNFEENHFDDYYHYDNADKQVSFHTDPPVDKSVHSNDETIELMPHHDESNELPDIPITIATNNYNHILNTSPVKQPIIQHQKIKHTVSEPETEPEPEIEKSFSAESAHQTPVLKPIQNKQITKLVRSRTTENLNVTPMPEYNDMDTPNLKGELKRFGIKPLSKKQAIKKLVEIYEYTHRDKLKRSASCLNLNQESADIENAAKEMNLETNARLKKSRKNLKKATSDIGLAKSNEPMAPPTLPPLQEAPGPSLIKIGISSKTKKTSKTNKSLQEKTIDEHMLDLDESESDSEQMNTQQKVARKKKTIEESELKEIVYEFIHNDECVYLDVLNYVPLDYESLNARLQASLAPRKVNNKILMKILDEFCVTFTLKSLNTRGNLNKPKTQKPKKT